MKCICASCYSSFTAAILSTRVIIFVDGGSGAFVTQGECRRGASVWRKKIDDGATGLGRGKNSVAQQKIVVGGIVKGNGYGGKGYYRW